MPDSHRMHRVEVVVGWVLLVISVLGWPVSALTWAKDEPPTVLALSWIAITFTAYDVLKSSRIHKDQDQISSDG